MAGSNGHAASQSIPPTITRTFTRDILEGTGGRLVWAINQPHPGNPGVQIAKMLLRFDGEDNPDAVEVYGMGMIDDRIIGFRTTIRIEDVLCTDEVMDVATMKEEIEAAEEDEEEEEEEEEPDEPAAAAAPVVVLKKPEPPAAALPAPAPPTA